MGHYDVRVIAASGVAVTGMHYTGMAALHLTATAALDPTGSDVRDSARYHTAAIAQCGTGPIAVEPG